MKIIPVNSDGARRITVDMQERGTWVFRTYWNPTAGMWSLDILTEDEQPVVCGLALVPNVNICEPYPELMDAFNELRVADIAGTGNSTPDSLGSGAILAQYDVGDFEPESGIYSPIVDLEDVLQ